MVLARKGEQNYFFPDPFISKKPLPNIVKKRNTKYFVQKSGKKFQELPNSGVNMFSRKKSTLPRKKRITYLSFFWRGAARNEKKRNPQIDFCAWRRGWDFNGVLELRTLTTQLEKGVPIIRGL